MYYKLIFAYIYMVFLLFLMIILINLQTKSASLINNSFKWYKYYSNVIKDA